MAGPVQHRLQRLCGVAVGTMLVLFAAGCASRSFTVDAIKNPDVGETGRAYRLENANPEREDGDPLVNEAAGYVKAALSSKGMYEAPEHAPVDLNVEVDFGMEAAKEELVGVTEPIMQTITEPGYYATSTYIDDRGNQVSVTTFVPGSTYEVIAGWRDRNVTVTVYPKYLRITARESAKDAGENPPRELWSVYVTSEDSSESIEKSLPLLVAAAMDAIDQNTSSETTVTLTEDDERVVFVKKGM